MASLVRTVRKGVYTYVHILNPSKSDAGLQGEERGQWVIGCWLLVGSWQVRGPAGAGPAERGNGGWPMGFAEGDRHRSLGLGSSRSLLYTSLRRLAPVGAQLQGRLGYLWFHPTPGTISTNVD